MSLFKKAATVGLGLVGVTAYVGGKLIVEGGRLVKRGVKRGYETYTEDQRLRAETDRINAFCEDVKQTFEIRRESFEREFNRAHEEYLNIVAAVEEDLTAFDSLERDYRERTAREKLSAESRQLRALSAGVDKSQVEAEDSSPLKSGLGAGVIVSGGTVGLMTAVGTAGTGTALSALTGTAYVKATLAALGGGTLASGGLGMVGGMLTLGAAFLAPALIVGGLIAHNKIQSAHEEAQSREQDALKLQTESEAFFRELDAGIHTLREINHEFRNTAEFFSRLIKSPNILIELESEKYRDILTATKNILLGYGSLNLLDKNVRSRLTSLKDAFANCREDYGEFTHGTPLENQQLQELFDRALQTAQTELDIMAMRLGYGIVDRNFKARLEQLLSDGVTVKILYGFGAPNDMNNRNTNIIVADLKARFGRFPNFRIKRTNSHAKLFICDEKFCVSSSFNALTNDNFKRNSVDAWDEHGTLLSNRRRIADLRNRYFSF